MKRTTLLVLALVLALTPATAAPGNDDLAGAQAISGLPSTTQAENLDAGTEDYEPLPCGEMAATVWFSFTPAADATVTARTSGATFDTVLAAYTGEGYDSLINLDCNDDSWGSTQSHIRFDATAGETYYVQLGGFDGRTGSTLLVLEEASPEQGIGGTVTNSSDEPIPGVCPGIYNDEGSLQEYTITDALGRYLFDDVPAGTHKVLFSSCNEDYIGEWYHDKGNVEDADPVVVTEDAVTTVDEQLRRAAAIRGTVTEAAGQPLEGICVEAFHSVGNYASLATTNADGTYSVYAGLPGDYRVHFVDCVNGAYVDEWYDDKPDAGSANVVQVADEEVVAGIDAVLEPTEPPPPPADLALTSLMVENVPVHTDGGSTGVGWVRKVRVTVANLSAVDVEDAYLTVYACPATAGTCGLIADDSVTLAAAASVGRTYTWNGLLAWPMAGDVTLVAHISVYGDPDDTNNTQMIEHYMFAGGTGFGVGVGSPCPSLC